MRPSVLAVACFVVASGGAALAAHEWRQKLEQDFQSDDTNTRAAAVRSVDPDDKGAVRALMNILAIKETNKVDSFVRAAAIERLSAATDAKAIAEIAKTLGAKDPVLREAAAIALGRLKDADERKGLLRLFEDKDPGVRRACEQAIAALGSLDGVEPLLHRWEKIERAKERDYREILAIEAGLEKLTEQKYGLSREAWAEFWQKRGKGYKRPSEMTEEEKKKAAEAERTGERQDGKKEEIETTVRNIPLKISAEGKGPIPLLVIHDDSWSPKYLMPYLSSLDDVCRIYLIELPPISKLQIKKRNIGGYPYWPFDELCDAFDEIRKQYKHEKFAVLAHGFSTMIGMRYLTKHPENVSHMILVGTFPGDDAYGTMLDKLSAKATGHLHDKELDRAVKFHFINDSKTFKRFYDPKTNEELEELERKFFNLMFANQEDPEINEIWDRCKKPLSTSLEVMKKEDCESPPFDIMREKHPDVPVLVISGAKSIWFGVEDGKRVAKNYPVSEHVVLQNSAMMPWFEENQAFTDAVKSFFAKHSPKKK